MKAKVFFSIDSSVSHPSMLHCHVLPSIPDKEGPITSIEMVVIHSTEMWFLLCGYCNSTQLKLLQFNIR